MNNKYEISDKTKKYNIGRYGMMREIYLKENYENLYLEMITNGELLSHLEEIDRTASSQIQNVIERMAREEGVTDIMKVKDLQRWTGLMDNFRQSAEEIVVSELIYS